MKVLQSSKRMIQDERSNIESTPGLKSSRNMKSAFEVSAGMKF